MATNHGLFLSLFARKSSDKKFVAIYIVVRVSGLGMKRISTSISVPVSTFKNGRFVGRDSKTFTHEKNIRTLLSKLEAAYFRLIESNVLPYPETIVSNFLEGSEKEKTLGYIMDLMVNQKEISYKAGDASSHLPEKFRVLRNDVMEFVSIFSKRKDIPLRLVNLDFISSLANHLSSIPNSNVTVNKKISNLNQGLIYAVKNRWMESNPIASWKALPEPKTNLEYLSAEQFDQVLNFKVPNSTHEVIKDSFIFMCLTGMGFSDMKKFTYNDVIDLNGIPTIEYVRSKLKREGKKVRVPILPAVMELINLNFSKPIIFGRRERKSKGIKDSVFTVPSGQTYNDKLKTLFEYNDLVVDFSVSSHMARKTFGNMITEHLGIEAASQLLGHSSVSITEDAYVNNESDALLKIRSEKMMQKLGQKNKG